MRTELPLLSADWYRIAHLRPRLRSGIKAARQRIRGEISYLLSDPIAGVHHRMNETAYLMISACNGNLSIDKVWSNCVAARGDDAPTQSETIQIFSQAFNAAIFISDITPDAEAIVEHHTRVEGTKRRSTLNPLIFRVPLWDPDDFLNRILPYLTWLRWRVLRYLVGCVITLGVFLFVWQFEAVSDYTVQSIGNTRMLVWVWLVYPLMKALHELAHAVVIKLYGGKVHEVGVTLMFLSPIPYVDASSSIGFFLKSQRAMVAGAGILMEVLLASIALMLWLVVEPGISREILFSIVSVGALSTLIVNGNPLLRFDGYYVLCDLAELPNLASRSTRLWQSLAKTVAIGHPVAPQNITAPGELPWLVAYAPLSWIYRLGVFMLIAATAAQWNGTVGLLLLGVSLWLLILKPIIAALDWISYSTQARSHRIRAALLTATVSLLVAALAFHVPVPDRSYAHGVVWVPDDAMVRSPSDGFIEQLLIQDGQVVGAGTAIVRLRNELLQAQHDNVNNRLERQQVLRAQGFPENALAVRQAEDEIERLRPELDRLSRRLEGLVVRVAVGGKVTIGTQRLRIGQFVRQGELLAHVVTHHAPLVRALVRQEDVSRVSHESESISVQLSSHADAFIPARLVNNTPRAINALPTASMGVGAGGNIKTDPSDPNRLNTAEPYFQVDLRLEGLAGAAIGVRSLVTFEHGSSSTIRLTERFLRQTLLRYFKT